MKTYLQCVPCLFRQIVDAAAMAGATEIQLKQIMDQVGFHLKDFRLDTRPPEIAMFIHNLIKIEMDNPDPYKSLKQKTNLWAMSLYPQLKRIVKNSKDPLLTAVKIAIVGNYLDSGPQVNPHLFEKIDKIFQGKMESIIQQNPELFLFGELKEDLMKAGTILYLGDNAGEVVFDRVLIETILDMDKTKRFYFAARGKAIINDCLVADAIQCRIDECARVISSGSEAPGTILEHCSAEFLELMEEADLVIGKGQGNFESLVDREIDNIYHLFAVKCSDMALELGAVVEDLVLINNRNP